MKKTLGFVVIALALCLAPPSRGESQGSEYKPITDPFGDPANYEFSEDEKEDKEFFHLGRFIMVGLDLGVAIFTGGLGTSVQPGPYVGAKFLYFLDRSLAMEGAVHYSHHVDELRPNATQGADVDVGIIPFFLGARYYFDTKNAPKAIAVANPYLAFGAALFLRNQSLIANAGGFNPTVGSDSAFGGYGGAGVEFNVYHRHVYLGVDLRYCFVFWADANSTEGGILQQGDRSGGYFTTAGSLTYNF